MTTWAFPGTAPTATLIIPEAGPITAPVLMSNGWPLSPSVDEDWTLSSDEAGIGLLTGPGPGGGNAFLTGDTLEEEWPTSMDSLAVRIRVKLPDSPVSSAALSFTTGGGNNFAIYTLATSIYADVQAYDGQYEDFSPLSTPPWGEELEFRYLVAKTDEVWQPHYAIIGENDEWEVALDPAGAPLNFDWWSLYWQNFIADALPYGTIEVLEFSIWLLDGGGPDPVPPSDPKVQVELDPDIETPLFLAPGDATTTISEIVFANRSASGADFRLAVVPDGEELSPEHWIAYGRHLEGNHSQLIQVQRVMEAGDTLVAWTDGADVIAHVFGKVAE